MIAINNLSYFIGDRILYDQASLHIKPKDKIGLIGLNGTGKSTLLRLINGEITPDEGEISKSNDCTLGFLNQDLLSFISEDSILHVAMQAFRETLELQEQIDKILHQMEAYYEDHLVEKLARLQEQFEACNGYALQSRAEEILEGIGFSTSDLHRPLKEFSGGWRMRVMLAKLLLEKPSLLMLDEPTNHLDLPSIRWIEDYLKSYEGAYIVVSHDKQFLNSTSQTIVEVSSQKLNIFQGNYDFYLQEKEQRDEIQKSAFQNQQQKIKQTERFIERFRSKSTKARQVQSKIKALDRMDKVDDIVEENARVNFKFNFSQQSGRYIFQASKVSKAYPSVKILDNTNINIERGDKIALVGANGKGKSTILRIIYGSEPHDGEVKNGYNVITSFYAQHQLEALNLEHEIIEELKIEGTNKTEKELRSVLGCFLFTDEDVFKKIKVLSGGEKSRVALSKTLISEANFLLLDEPTNHLDIQSVNILIQALQQYRGSFVVVSHDRYFISQIANKIWWIQDNELKEYPGTFDEYQWWLSKQQPTNTQKAVKHKEKEKPPNHKPNKEADKILKSLKKEIEQLESDIIALESEKDTIEQDLSNPDTFNNIEKSNKLQEKYASIQNKLKILNQQWEEMGSKLEELKD